MPKKNNIAYVKPREPAFLARLKQEAGFIEGPTIDTKKEALPAFNDDDLIDRAEDSPVVVVLRPGDLTQQEADELKKEQESEEANRPANLEDRIIFKSQRKREATEEEKPKKKAKTKPTNSKLLSFDEEDLDD